MKILFVSNDLIAGDLARILQNEGNEVKLYIDDKKRRTNFQNIVPTITNWKRELNWVGKDGLIVFDDVGYGQIQEDLRKKGYTVFGGNILGDKLELDRDFGQKVFAEHGLRTAPLKDFDNIRDAIIYVEENPRAWVIKQNNHHYSKVLNYIGKFEDGRDVIDMLKTYLKNRKYRGEKISLQQKILGVEIGIGRYFNGVNWVGPIEYNVEHTRFFPEDIGPLTSEMGTLAWYDDDETKKLYQEVLIRLTPYLQKINFRGDFEINCIINETGIYPLEATTRFGSPIVHLHEELHISPWGEFLCAIARGENYDLKWKKGYGIVTLLAAPPFPYGSDSEENAIIEGTTIYFDNISKEEFSHIHLEEVSKDESGQYYISDTRGYIAYVTATGSTISDAQKSSRELINKIHFPKMIYRNDIGLSFEQKDKKLLEELGYL